MDVLPRIHDPWQHTQDDIVKTSNDVVRMLRLSL